MEQAQFIGHIVSDVILLATLGVVIWYTIKTADMAEATKLSAESAQKTIDEMREARDQESAPYVISYFDAAEHDHFIYFVVKNEGKSVAHNVRLAITPPLANSRGQLQDIVLLTEGVASLAPGQEIRTFFDSAIGVFSREDVPLRYNAQITYTGGAIRRERVSDQTLDLAAYRGLLFMTQSGMPELVKAVEEVKDYLGKAQTFLGSMSGRLDKGIWVQNSDSVVSDSFITGAIAYTSIMTKLREFQLIWDSAPRDQQQEIQPTRLDLQPRIIAFSRQVLMLLAGSHEFVAPELAVAIAQIAASLLELGTMSYRTEGGRFITRFNEVGNAVAATVQDVIAKLQAKEAIEESHNAIQPQAEAGDEANAKPTVADDIAGDETQEQSEELGDQQDGDRG